MPLGFRARREALVGPRWQRQLEAEKVPEWRDHYIDVAAVVKRSAGYGTMTKFATSSDEPSAPTSPTVMSPVSKPKHWWSKVQDSVFAEDSIARASAMQAFEESVDVASALAESQSSATAAKLQVLQAYVKEHRGLPERDQRILLAAAVEIFTVSVLLENFCSLNCVIFHQIGKYLHPTQNNYVLWLVKNAQHPPPFIKILLDVVPRQQVLACKCYAEMKGLTLTDAEAHLQQKLKPPLPTFLAGLKLGLHAGMCVPLFLVDLYLTTLPFPGLEQEHMLYGNLPLIRCTAVVLLAMWLWGLCVAVMNERHINYAFIMDLDPATCLHWKQVLEFAALWTNLWLWTHCIFTLQLKLKMVLIPEWVVPTSFLPSVFFILAVLIFLCPLDIVHRPTRWWILKQLFAVAASPFVPVTFASNFVGDFLTSMVKVLIDINYSAYHIISGAWRMPEIIPMCPGQVYVGFFLTLLPLNFRLLQCLRRFHDDGRRVHLWNFGKYATSMAAVLFGVLNPAYYHMRSGWPWGRMVYLALLVASTIYSWLWDVLMDWGLYSWKTGGGLAARPVVIPYARTLSPALDLLGRCAWAYTIVVEPPGDPVGVAWLIFFTAMVEVLRRSMWAVIRFSNEHYNNASQYRVVKEVPLSQLSMTPLPVDSADFPSEFTRWHIAQQAVASPPSQEASTPRLPGTPDSAPPHLTLTPPDWGKTLLTPDRYL